MQISRISWLERYEIWISIVLSHSVDHTAWSWLHQKFLLWSVLLSMLCLRISSRQANERTAGDPGAYRIFYLVCFVVNVVSVDFESPG